MPPPPASSTTHSPAASPAACTCELEGVHRWQEARPTCSPQVTQVAAPQNAGLHRRHPDFLILPAFSDFQLIWLFPCCMPYTSVCNHCVSFPEPLHALLSTPATLHYKVVPRLSDQCKNQQAISRIKPMGNGWGRRVLQPCCCRHSKGSRVFGGPALSYMHLSYPSVPSLKRGSALLAVRFT